MSSHAAAATVTGSSSVSAQRAGRASSTSYLKDAAGALHSLRNELADVIAAAHLASLDGLLGFGEAFLIDLSLSSASVSMIDS